MKTLTNYYNPIVNLEKTFEGLFNFSGDDKCLTVQVDLPGVAKDKLDLSTDSDKREVYIKATRQVKTQEGQRDQTYNRSFSIGREYDLNKIEFIDTVY